MIIETYSDKYYNDVIQIMDNFYVEAIQAFDDSFDKNVLAETITKLKDSGTGNAFLLIIDDKCEGMLAGIEAPSMLNDKRVFQEIVWYVNKPFRKYGIRLLKKAQEMLKADGFDTMIMAVLESSKPVEIKRLYERMGFMLFETHYIKAL